MNMSNNESSSLNTLKWNEKNYIFGSYSFNSHRVKIENASVFVKNECETDLSENNSGS